MKNVSHVLEYAIVLVVSTAIGLLPFSFMDTLAGWVAAIIVPLFPGATRRIKTNLERVYYPWLAANDPDYEAWSAKKEKDFIRTNLRHSLRVSMEIFHSRKFKNPRFIDKYMAPDSPWLYEHFQNQKNGIVLLEGHLGNWELAISFYYRYGVSISFVAKHLSNPYVDKMLLRRRKTYGGTNFFMEESSGLVKHLRQKEIIGLVADQDAGATGILVDFFGKKASTFAGPAIFTYLSGAELMVFSCVFIGKGKYKVNLIPVLPAGSVPKGSRSKDVVIQEVTQKWVSTLETECARYPEQYFWIHRRWKHSPGWVR